MKDTPETIAYRLTKVEEAVKELGDKLERVVGGFATHKDIEPLLKLPYVAKEQARLEHDAIYEKIRDVERDVLQLKKRNWVQNTLSAVLGAVITLLVAYFINDIVR